MGSVIVGLLSADFVEKLFERALWLQCGECYFATQLIANPDSKNPRGAKRYSTVGVCLARHQTFSTQSALSGRMRLDVAHVSNGPRAELTPSFIEQLDPLRGEARATWRENVYGPGEAEIHSAGGLCSGIPRRWEAGGNADAT